MEDLGYSKIIYMPAATKEPQKEIISALCQLIQHI